MKKININLIKSLTFIKPFKKTLLNLAVSQIIMSLFGIIGPLVFMVLIDNVLVSNDKSILNFLLFGLIGIFIFQKCIHVIKSYFGVYFDQKLKFNLKKIVFLHVQTLDLTFYEYTKTGEIVHRIIEDVDTVSNFLKNMIINIMVNGFMLIIYLIIMIYINFLYTVLSLLFTIPLMIIVLFFSEKLRHIYKKIGEKTSDMYAYLYEILYGIKTIKIFSREKRYAYLFINKTSSLTKENIKSGFWSTCYGLLYESIQYLGYIFVIWYGSSRVFEGVITAGSLIAFISYYWSIYGPIQGILDIYKSIQTSIPAIDRLYKFLNEKTEFKKESSFNNKIEGRIIFKNVFFKYKDNESYALENINIEINPGEAIALVGPSGAGKSTFINLIPNFYPLEKGEIIIDNFNIKNMDTLFLRKNISMVLQEPFLFSGTIRENILLGKPNATEEELINAAQKANIHDFIVTLPNNYDTDVRERGIRLSGGEKQRITIARAILKDTKILIFDEATSSIDSLSESLIQDSLDKLMKNRTTLIIAHRLSTILKSDRIIVLDQGKIVGIGKHDELFKNNALYKTLCQIQFSKKNSN